ncbi:MAG: nuclease [Alphaproteobacteria bacterium]|nr:nuclease [Alphaproteobacteria bacterium]
MACSCSAPATPLPRRRSRLALALSAALVLPVGFPVVFANDRQGPLPGPLATDPIAIVDGDTTRVRVRIWLDQDVETLVRLEGIDAPELKGRCAVESALAQQARATLAGLIGEGPVLLRDVRHDKYGGRVRAAVCDDTGRDLGARLTEAGLARAYAGGARASWCPAE